MVAQHRTSSACRNVKFSPSPVDLLAVSEHENFCHILDARNLSSPLSSQQLQVPQTATSPAEVMRPLPMQPSILRIHESTLHEVPGLNRFHWPDLCMRQEPPQQNHPTHLMLLIMSNETCSIHVPKGLSVRFAIGFSMVNHVKMTFGDSAPSGIRHKMHCHAIRASHQYCRWQTQLGGNQQLTGHSRMARLL